MSQISYAPPRGPPPSFYPEAHIVETPGSEPPPPYTARANDPLPAWASLTPDFEDFTDKDPQSYPIRLPLDPPPECFSTSSPRRIRSHSFAPFRIPSRGKNLTGGFKLLYAPNELGPHGISAKDWIRFLQDLGLTARVSSGGFNAMSTSPPSPRLGGFLRGRAGSVYDSAFGKTPMDEVANLINVWNQSAFERRKVRVTLHVKTDERGNIREGYDLLVEAL